MKTGVNTSEFWVTVVMGIATAVLGVLVTNGLVSGELSSNIAQALGLLVAAAVPVVLGWLGTSYTRSRTALKIESQPGWAEVKGGVVAQSVDRQIQIEPVHLFSPE
jgi:hypothetical protein